MTTQGAGCERANKTLTAGIVVSGPGSRREIVHSLSRSGESSRWAGRPAHLNPATHAEQEALPGIGPVIARRIIEGRPYRSVNELDRVKGIGKKRLGEIRPLVTAE